MRDADVTGLEMEDDLISLELSFHCNSFYFTSLFSKLFSQKPGLKFQIESPLKAGGTPIYIEAGENQNWQQGSNLA